MKKWYFFLIICILSVNCLSAQSSNQTVLTGIDYFIPQGNYQFNPKIPTPKSVFGFEIGEQYVDWNDVLKYVYNLKSVSDRVSIREYGRTFQHRPFIQVIITSAENQKKLEQIREEHLSITDVSLSNKLDIKEMPVIVNLMGSIHGNEPSGVNASLIAAYFFTAAESEEVTNLLKKTILIITPGQNPDGINRFASWVNSSRSFTESADLNSREFNEAWPSSRTNHYWADSNRDWLMLQYPEGINAVKMYMSWMPNVVGDFHEQGGNGKGYYFSPGHPLRTNSLTPEKNQKLTSEITKHIAAAFDKIGVLYYSKEGYDDFYYGKGAAYGDMQGSVAFLCEQVATKGFLRPTAFGNASFASTVRNQSVSMITTVFASFSMKDTLLDYQRKFYVNSSRQAAADKIKGYVFNSRGNKGIEYHFLETLQRHGIEVYKLKDDLTVGKQKYSSSDSYIVPTAQKYYYKVRTLFENVSDFRDSTFYDISTWTFPHAYNLEYSPVTVPVLNLLGERADKLEFPKGTVIGGKSTYAYLFDNKEYYTPKLVASLLKDGILVRVCGKPITFADSSKTLKFSYGTFIVPVSYQNITSEDLYKKISAYAAECGVTVHSMNSGLMSDLDLGSPSIKNVRVPKIAMLVGQGMGVEESGEIWHMLDQRFNIPMTLMDLKSISTADLSQYNVLVFSGGVPAQKFSEADIANLKEWVAKGGEAIFLGKAIDIARDAKISDIEVVSKDEKPGAISGVILNCKLDKTSVLGWGYSGQNVAVMKNGTRVYGVKDEKAKVPMSYLKDSFLSGCISQKDIIRLGGTPAIITEPYKKGQIVFFADDVNFRSYWFGASKIFMNAVLFGELL